MGKSKEPIRLRLRKTPAGLVSLYHDLNTKPQKIPKEVKTQVEQNDSIVYKERAIYETNEVEVERELTWWQKTQMYGFWITLLIIVITHRKSILYIIKSIFKLV